MPAETPQVKAGIDYKIMPKAKQYWKNPKKYIEQAAKWNKEHKEINYRARRNWHKRHPEYYKIYSQKHLEEIHRNQRKWEKNHPEYCRMKVKIRRSRLRGAEGSHTLNEWKRLKKEYNYCCAICKKQEPFIDQWYQWLTEDHIIPIKRGGTNWISNIQPTCVICNSKKSKILPKEVKNG